MHIFGNCDFEFRHNASTAHAVLFRADEECILPRNSTKNQLHDALENNDFEAAGRLMASNREAYLVECFEDKQESWKSCLHVIAAMYDEEKAGELCTQLLEKIKNKMNKKYLLDARTVDEFEFGGPRSVRARVAPIHIAAYSGNAEIVRLLCREYGVDVNCRTSDASVEESETGVTPLQTAAENSDTEVATPQSEENNNVSLVTPMFIAAHEGHAEVVRVMINNKADVNASCAEGRTPLYAASCEGHEEVVKLLLDNKADVNASRHTNGATPLHVASVRGHVNVVKLLLANNADVNSRRLRGGTKGCTPLFEASREGHADVVKLLLDNKADVNEADIPMAPHLCMLLLLVVMQM